MTNDYEQQHQENLSRNRKTVRLIADGKSDFEILLSATVNDLTSRVCQERSITRKAAKKLITGLIEVTQCFT